MSELTSARAARRAAPIHAEAGALGDDDVTSFSGAIGWTIAGTLLPGLGFMRARRWFEGILTFVCFLGLAAGLAFLAYERDFIVALTTTPITSLGIVVLCAMLGVLITLIIVTTYGALRPRLVSPRQRIGGAVLVLVLCFLVCLPLAIGAGYVMGQAGMVR